VKKPGIVQNTPLAPLKLLLENTEKTFTAVNAENAEKKTFNAENAENAEFFWGEQLARCATRAAGLVNP
jgi:hypothetical protein